MAEDSVPVDVHAGGGGNEAGTDSRKRSLDDLAGRSGDGADTTGLSAEVLGSMSQSLGISGGDDADIVGEADKDAGSAAEPAQKRPKTKESSASGGGGTAERCAYHKKRKRACPENCPHRPLPIEFLDASSNDSMRGPPNNQYRLARPPLTAEQAALLTPTDGDAIRAGTLRRKCNSNDLSWDANRRINKEGIYCYCGLGRTNPSELESADVVMLPCVGCRQWFHSSCLISAIPDRDMPVPGDLRFGFVCGWCNSSAPGTEVFKQFANPWLDVCHIALYNLILRERRAGSPKTEFHARTELCPYIDAHWDSLHGPSKERTKTWENTVAACISQNKAIFKSHRALMTEGGDADAAATSTSSSGSGMYTLVEPELDPSYIGGPDSGMLNRARSKTVKQSAEVLAMIDEQQKAFLSTLTGATSPSGVARMRRTDGPDSSAAEARAQALASEASSLQGPMLYPLPMYHPFYYGYIKQQLAKQNSASQVKLTLAQHLASNDRGYRTCRSAFGVRSGLWYCEIKIHDSETLAQYAGKVQPHTRLGWSTARADKQSPVGFDAFGFGYRDKPAARFYRARGTAYGVEYGPGDVVGLLIWLPPEGRPQVKKVEPESSANGNADASAGSSELDTVTGDEDIVLRELLDDAAVPAHTVTVIGGIAYSTVEPAPLPKPASGPSSGPNAFPDLPVHKGSAIAFFVNGQSQGVAFADIPQGTYYPSASLYYGATVKFGFGPKLDYPPSASDIQAICGRHIQLMTMSDAASEPPPAPVSALGEQAAEDKELVKTEMAEPVKADGVEPVKTDAAEPVKIDTSESAEANTGELAKTDIITSPFATAETMLGGKSLEPQNDASESVSNTAAIRATGEQDILMTDTILENESASAADLSSAPSTVPPQQVAEQTEAGETTASAVQ